jgi:signal transduction histidine kinase
MKIYFLIKKIVKILFVYTLTMIISAILIVPIFYLISIYFESNTYDAVNLIEEDYKSINFDTIKSADGWGIVLDNNLKVIISTSESLSGYKKGYKFEKIEFNSKFINSSDYYSDLNSYEYNYTIAYNNKIYLITAIPEKFYYTHIIINGKTYYYYKLLIIISVPVIFFVILLTSFFSYFINPLRKLNRFIKKTIYGNFKGRLKNNNINEYNLLISSINKMSKEIKNNINEIEKIDEERQMFILSLSHDIKTPLTSIISFSDYFIKTKKINNEDIKYLGVINSNIKKVDILLSDLNKISEYNEFKKERKDIIKFLIRFCNEFSVEIRKSNHNFNFLIPKTELYIDFSEKNLERAIFNIVNNSVKHNIRSIDINLIAEISNGEYPVIISIEDNGIGIKDKIKDKIFEPYNSYQNNSKCDSNGIGLYVSKLIIEKHKGKLLLETSNKEKTIFKIYLR